MKLKNLHIQYFRFTLHQRRTQCDSTTYSNLQTAVNSLLNKMRSNLQVLLQLETRLSNMEALEASQHFAALIRSSFFSDGEVVEWLTKHKKNGTQYPFDVALIRQLVAWDVKELQTKNIYAHVCKNNLDCDAATLYRNLNTPAFKRLPSHLENEFSKYWPKLIHLDEVIRLGWSF